MAGWGGGDHPHACLPLQVWALLGGVTDPDASPAPGVRPGSVRFTLRAPPVVGGVRFPGAVRGSISWLARLRATAGRWRWTARNCCVHGHVRVSGDCTVVGPGFVVVLADAWEGSYCRSGPKTSFIIIRKNRNYTRKHIQCWMTNSVITPIILQRWPETISYVEQWLETIGHVEHWPETIGHSGRILDI